MSGLVALDLRYNRLAGPIPSVLGGLEQLVSLRLEHNELTGSVPAELGALDNLSFLRLSGNDLARPFPPGALRDQRPRPGHRRIVPARAKRSEACWPTVRSCLPVKDGLAGGCAVELEPGRAPSRSGRASRWTVFAAA